MVYRHQVEEKPKAGEVRQASSSSDSPQTVSGSSMTMGAKVSTVMFLFLATMGGWPCATVNADYIIPAAFPGQWLNRMAAEAELDRPSSFSLQHLHGGVGVKKRAPEQYDEMILPSSSQQSPVVGVAAAADFTPFVITRQLNSQASTNNAGLSATSNSAYSSNYEEPQVTSSTLYLNT